METRPAVVVVAAFDQWDASTEDGEAPMMSDEYVFDVQTSRDMTEVFASISTGVIKAYSLPSMAFVRSFDEHQGAVTDFCVEASGRQIASCAHDGLAKLWDSRSNKATMTVEMAEHLGKNPTCCALGYEGALLACGGGPRIVFFDVRQQARPVGTLGEAIHSEDLLRLRFHPTKPGLLASAGEDGLVAVFDTAAAAGTENLVSILNAEAAVTKFDFFGDGLEGVHVLTASEGLQLWHFPSGQRFHVVEDVRAACNSLLAGTSIDTAVDLLYRSELDKLYLVGGSFSGDAALFEVSPSRTTVVKRLRGGHRGPMRGTCWASSTGDLLTCGEDARICAWMESPESQVPEEEPVVRQTAKQNRRRRGFKPY